MFKEKLEDFLRGGIKYFWFLPVVWEMIQFDEHFFHQWVETSTANSYFLLVKIWRKDCEMGDVFVEV